MAESVDIDLYDNIDENFDQGGDFNQDGDLYDDVIITASSSEPADTVSRARHQSEETTKTPAPTSIPATYKGKRYSVYVGNLTWVSHLTSVGGSSIDNMANRILKYIMTNPLAKRYNWTGANHKFAFRSLTLPVILKLHIVVKENEWTFNVHFSGAIKSTFRLVTSADIETCVKSFLKSAKDRDGGRRRRRMKEKETNAPTATNTSITSSDSDSNN